MTQQPRRKICVVVTARPSYARIKSALFAIEKHPALQLQLVVGGSALLHDYGQPVRFMRADGLAVSEEVYMVVEGENPVTSVKTTGLAIIELAGVFDRLRPNVVLTIADRYETLATAVAASYMNIPVAHVQGGEITGSIDEKVRHAVTKLSNLHFVATNRAAERVIRMGEDPDTVFVTGCPSVDLAAAVMQRPQLDFDPFTRYGGVGATFSLSDGYLVVLQHPVTTEYKQAREQVTESLWAVHESGLPAFWFWPNVDAGSEDTSKGIRAFREAVPDARIHFFTSLTPEDFLRLALNSRCLVGNSSVGIRESSYLGIPAVNVGPRQGGRERGENVLDVGYDRKEILCAIRKQVSKGRYPQNRVYGDGTAGSRIAALLAECELCIEKRIAY